MLRWNHFHETFLNLTIILTISLCLSHAFDLDSFDEGYGSDISFPMQYELVSSNYPWLPHNIDPMNNPTPPEYIDMPIQVMGDKRKFYNNFLEGCKSHYGKHAYTCQATENARIKMTLHQPSSMQNYTELGFKKIKTPETVWKLLKNFWDHNKDKKKAENWHKGNTYTNHWVAPTYMVDVGDSKLRGGGKIIKQALWDAAKETIQEWTGEELTECSLYGVRVYTEGSVLSPHVDRLPLVSSAIVNIAQDVDEPWPLEVIGHDGRAHNVTMEPGDMVLYESHSVIHGRPFPLKGRYYANIFIHFEPIGHSLRHDAFHTAESNMNEKYRNAVAKRHGGHENEVEGLPPYIISGSEEGNLWKRMHPNDKRSAKPAKSQTGSNAIHAAARKGDMSGLEEVVSILNHLINETDSNGWTPLHEGARAGHTDIVKLLVHHEADINALTKDGKSPLYIAAASNGKDHPIVSLFESLGALSIGPEL